MEKTREKRRSRESLIQQGKFSVLDQREDPLYRKLVNVIPDNTKMGVELLSQINEAFRFNDQDMKMELTSFVNQFVMGQTELIIEP